MFRFANAVHIRERVSVVQVRYATLPDSAETATTAELRARYLVEDLFVPGEVRGVYTHEDRMVVAGALPGAGTLSLPAWPVLGTPTHLTRRELGVVNVGEVGQVVVDGVAYTLGHLDGLYAGRGSDVEFRGADAAFYLVSVPAVVVYPVAVFGRDTVEPVEIGSDEGASCRSLYKYLWGDVHPSNQLQFGVTVIAKGSVWNTMPAHLHERRTEVYLYADLEPSARVVHLMGRPGATRHLMVAGRQAVISPAWSMHAGAGTSSYAFIWAMAGENTTYTDLAPIPMDAL